MTAEVVAQRWVPLIMRDIMVGYHRFNEIRHVLTPSSEELKVEGSGSFTGIMPEEAEVGAEPRLR
ncbi:MAG: hypothetical protein ABI860_04710 [Gemmatimonadales bacterium]